MDWMKNNEAKCQLKKYILILVWMLSISCVFSQEQELDPPESKAEKMSGPFFGQSLKWMLGKWNGEGKQRSVAFSSDLEVSSILSETGLLLKRNSSGGYQEVILLGYDINSKKNVATLYDNRYHTGLFTCTVSETELSCSQIVSVQGYASQRSYRLLPDGTISFSIDTQSTGKQVQRIVEIVFKSLS